MPAHSPKVSAVFKTLPAAVPTGFDHEPSGGRTLGSRKDLAMPKRALRRVKHGPDRPLLIGPLIGLVGLPPNKVQVHVGGGDWPLTGWVLR